MRQGLLKPCRCPVRFTDASLAHMNNIGQFRDLCLALSAEGKACAAAGKHMDSAESYIDMVRLAQQASRGGLFVDDLVADSLERIGLFALPSVLNQLDQSELALVRKNLETLAVSREPIEAVVERERLWNHLALGWPGRLLCWISPTLVGGNVEAVSDARMPGIAQLRLLLAETAVRQYVLAEGAPPESLASLVPEYLSAVPRDPYRDAPLVYRRTPDGYLLYSVGNNGVNDGGQRASFLEATIEGKGDLFFDAPFEMPGDAPDKMPGATEEAPADAGDTATPPQCLWFSSKKLVR
jgi:hypothetical protein